MRNKVAAVTLALALPSFLWPPKPARAATVQFAPTVSVPTLAGIDRADKDNVEQQRTADVPTSANLAVQTT